ncbi:MAG: hypothetical protein B7X08_06965 [Acidocella sp. 20-63-7]|nr:MAG: hypothetical protein B7X08_06965 [Acidocella sp. 20-63-7]
MVSQTFYRSLTLVPVAMILLGRVHFGGGVAVTVPLLVFLTGQLALFFISVMVGADDAPELAASAPVPLEMRDRAALFAAAYAALLLMALPLLGVLWRAAALIPVLLACMAGVGASNLLLGQRLPIPLVRARFGKAQTGTVLGLVLGVGVSSAWALASWLLATPSLAAFLQAG